MPEVRAAQGVFGKFEMTEAQHQELLDAIHTIQGMVMISGYRSKLYDKELGHWTSHQFDRPNNAAGDVVKRRMTEVLWCNFDTSQKEAI